MSNLRRANHILFSSNLSLPLALVVAIVIPKARAQEILTETGSVGVASLFASSTGSTGGLVPLDQTAMDEAFGPLRTLSVTGGAFLGQCDLEVRRDSQTSTLTLRAFGGNLGTGSARYGTGNGIVAPITIRTRFLPAGTAPVSGSLVVRWSAAATPGNSATLQVNAPGTTQSIPVLPIDPLVAPGFFDTTPPLQSAVLRNQLVDPGGYVVDATVTADLPAATLGDGLRIQLTIGFFPDVVSGGGCTVTQVSDSCPPAGILCARFPSPVARTLEAPIFAGPAHGFAFAVLAIQSSTLPLGSILPVYAQGCLGLGSSPTVAPHPMFSGTGDALNTVAIPSAFSGTLYAQVVSVDGSGRFGASNAIRVSCP